MSCLFVDVSVSELDPVYYVARITSAKDILFSFVRVRCNKYVNLVIVLAGNFFSLLEGLEGRYQRSEVSGFFPLYLFLRLWAPNCHL